MDVKQILIIGLFLVPLCKMSKMNRCYDEGKLSEAAERKLRSHYQQPPELSSTAEAGSPAVCPVALYRRGQHQSLEDRSLSPWRYVQVTKNDHYPPTFFEAECLCSGCILIQNKKQGSLEVVESHDYNSVPVVQSRVFLKRELCDVKDGKKKYHLKPVSVKVAVGCTCARVTSTSS